MGGADLLNICFHGIGTPGRELEPGEDGYWVAADRYLLILDEIATWPSAQVSFDDGNASDVEAGLPGLVERGLTARFFVLAGRLGSPGSLAASDVRMLAAHGMSVGTHGMSHRSWRGIDPSTRQAELVEAVLSPRPPARWDATTGGCLPICGNSAMSASTPATGGPQYRAAGCSPGSACAPTTPRNRCAPRSCGSLAHAREPGRTLSAWPNGCAS
jgi:hypothetical protein